MRRTNLSIAWGSFVVTTLTLVLAACGGGESVSTMEDKQGAPTTSATADTTAAAFPEGTYWTSALTYDDALAALVEAGYSNREAEDILSGWPMDVSRAYGVRIQSGRWVILESVSGVDGVGWEGTFVVIDDDTVKASELSTGATWTYRYEFEGDTVSFDVVDARTGGGADIDPEEFAIQTYVYETAPFERMT
jgi:hypothetical protein